MATFARIPTAVAAGLLLTASNLAGAQDSLTLRDALQRAGSHSFANRAAAARRDAADAAGLAARRGLLPNVRVDAGFIRTTDPVGAFGTSLRQQRISAVDFDPNRLNFPGAVNNFTGALIIEQPLLALDAWMAASAGNRAAAAARHGESWTAVSTQVDVISAYYGATLAASHATTLAVATRAARAHVLQADAMLEAGLVTRSDALLAATRAAEIDAARLDAVRDSVLAIRRLTVLLGSNTAQSVVPVSGFPTDSAIANAARQALALESRPRADMDGARESVDAAATNLSRSRAAFLPRLAGFARQDLNSSARPFAGASNWTVGLMASWTPFSGASELADTRLAEARRAEAEAALAGAAANVAVDLEQTQLTLSTALARMDVMRIATDQAAEAHRIVSRKYDGGLASVAELLDAFATETQARLQFLSARYAVLTAVADRLRALGLQPASMADFDFTNHSGQQRPQHP